MNPPLVISTGALPARQQFDAWHAAACGRGYEVSREAPSSGFPAEMRLWRCGPLGFAHVAAPPGRRWRGPGHVRADSADEWVVSLETGGWRRTRCGDAVSEGRAGSLAIRSRARPFDEERSAIETVYLFVPRDAAPTGASAALDALCGRTLGGGPATLFSDFLASAARALPDLEPGQVSPLAQATRGMLGVLAGLPAGRREEAAGGGAATLRAAQLARCERLVARHLGAATLGPDMLARLSGVPRSSLYRLFEPHGGVAAYVQRERLRRAAAALGDPADARRVARVAAACGFFDPSAFARLFRARFGATPTEFRRAAWSGLPPPPPRRAGPLDAPAGSFAGFLRSLRSEA